jgi:hypothetical protein
MFNGKGRWYWLTFLALGNLVLWMATAAVVGLLVSDQMDLGFETELRQVQATAIAGWRELSTGEFALLGRSTPLASSARPSPTPLATRQPAPTSGVTWAEPLASPAEDPTSEEANAAGTIPEFSASGVPATSSSSTAAGSLSGPAALLESTESTRDGSAVGKGQGTAQGTGRPSPQPTLALLTQPLLLADPEFHSLAALNAEMARSAPGRVVQIRYQETVLSREIRTVCENNPDLPLRNVQVDLRRDQLVLTGEITVLAFQVNAKVSGTVVARDCRPQIQINTIAMGGVLTPQVVRDQIEQQVLEAMTWYPADYPLCLEQIVLEDTRATIYGYRR